MQRRRTMQRHQPDELGRCGASALDCATKLLLTTESQRSADRHVQYTRLSSIPLIKYSGIVQCWGLYIKEMPRRCRRHGHPWYLVPRREILVYEKEARALFAQFCALLPVLSTLLCHHWVPALSLARIIDIRQCYRLVGYPFADGICRSCNDQASDVSTERPAPRTTWPHCCPISNCSILLRG